MAADTFAAKVMILDWLAGYGVFFVLSKSLLVSQKTSSLLGTEYQVMEIRS